MTTKTPDTTDAANTPLLDELRLQAWLASAEARNPSLHAHVSSLAQLRDRLKLQVGLGKMEARDRWEELESAWQELRPRLDAAIETASDEVTAALDRIREGYEELGA